MSIEEKLKEAERVITEGVAMRKLQKAYFKSMYDDQSRSAEYLSQSKIQEKKFDQMAEQFFRVMPKDLFS